MCQHPADMLHVKRRYRNSALKEKEFIYRLAHPENVLRQGLPYNLYRRT